MIMVSDALPLFKRFTRLVPFKGRQFALITRLVAAFILHSGRMSCLSAAGAVRSEPRHRAQICRFLARPSLKRLDPCSILRQVLLDLEAIKGRFIFIIDATLCSHSGELTTNTYSTGNRKRRPKKGRRYGKQKHKPKNVHSFTKGLLITPSGIRIPYSIPHYTKQYCEKRGWEPRTTAESAADLIASLPLPEGADVVVLGDTAYDADVVREACAQRQYTWIFPCNPERVLDGPKGRRPKVRSLLQQWTKWSRQTIRLVPSQGKYAVYRRLSAHRIGPKIKPRTFIVHEETRKVRSVGECRLVFSTLKTNLQSATPDDVKILLTNNTRLSLRDVVELYSLRWQIELFFKELKSVLGFHQYRFREFEAVEGWVQMQLLTFMYLEWFRAQQLQRRDLDDEAKNWWRRQRTYGLCQAIRMASQQVELEFFQDRLATPRGIAKLRQIIRNSFTKEYRAAL